jgi:hypothetical protein
MTAKVELAAGPDVVESRQPDEEGAQSEMSDERAHRDHDAPDQGDDEEPRQGETPGNHHQHDGQHSGQRPHEEPSPSPKPPSNPTKHTTVATTDTIRRQLTNGVPGADGGSGASPGT